MEAAGRGIVAVRAADGTAYVGWRMLGTDPDDVAFNLYRATDGGPPTKVNAEPIVKSTDCVDAGEAGKAARYFVRPIVDGGEARARGRRRSRPTRRAGGST